MKTIEQQAAEGYGAYLREEVIKSPDEKKFFRAELLPRGTVMLVTRDAGGNEVAAFVRCNADDRHIIETFRALAKL